MPVQFDLWLTIYAGLSAVVVIFVIRLLAGLALGGPLDSVGRGVLAVVGG